jgi:hypothetical protein
VACQFATIVITWPVWNVRSEPANLPLMQLPGLSFGWPVVLSLLVALVWPRVGVALHAGIVAAAIVWDQYRLQPQFLSLIVLMAGCVWPTGTALARWYLAAMWLWAGLHKLLSPEWYGFQSALFLTECGLSDEWHVGFAILVGLGEVTLGILAALAPRRAAIPCLLVHLGILLALSGLRDFNSSVWPWNLATAVVGMWVLRQDAPTPAGWPRWAAAMCFLVPAGFFVNLVNPHLAFVLYSGNMPRATHIAHDSTHRIDGWAGLDVPFPDSPRLFVEMFRRTASGGEKLHIADPRWGIADRYYLKLTNGTVKEVTRARFLASAGPTSDEVIGLELEDPNVLFWLDRTGVELAGPQGEVVWTADAAGPQITNSTLTLIGSLRNLRELRIERAAIDDRAIPVLASLDRLELLAIKNCPLSEAGLEQLPALPSLRWLHLDRLPHANRKLAALDRHPQLEVLHLTGTELTEPILKQIGGLAQLTWLNLSDSELTGELTELTKLQRLTWLDLSGTQIGNEALPSLGQLSSLEVLQLARTKVTDAGMEHLQSLGKLEQLDLRNTSVTSASIESLKKALPACVITLE